MRGNKDAKELLLADYEYLSESFWKNEGTGETRVNIFIGLVTLVVGALVGLVTKDKSSHPMSDDVIQVIVLSSLASLFVLGLIFLARMMKRNRSTDICKIKLDTIRQIFKDHFDDEQVLQDYSPVLGAQKGTVRKFGGLTHLVAGINSMLFAGIAAISCCSVLLPSQCDQHFKLILVTTTIITTFIISFAIQYLTIHVIDKRNKNELQIGRHTHAGAVVIDVEDSIDIGSTKYLLVKPSKPDLAERVLPKGKIKKHEGHIETAEREVEEESGYVVRKISVLDTIEFQSDEKLVKAKFYLMKKIYQTGETNIDNRHKEITMRDPRWYSYDDAMAALRHPESKYLLTQAHRKLEHFKKREIEGAWCQR